MEQNFLKQKEDENWIQFADRIISAKENGLIDLDKSEIYELLFCEKLSSDESRKRLYSVKKVVEILKNEQYQSISDDKILKQIEKAQREIYKERQKLRDEKNEYNAWLKEQARMELFFERIDESVDRLIKTKPRNIPEPITLDDEEIKIVCSFADCHYGVEFNIQGFNNEIINIYNPEVFKNRMWKLRDELLEFCKIHNCYNVSIVDLGDSIENILHISQIKSLRGNIVDDIMDYAEFIADWLENLSNKIYIDFYTSEGNHGDLRLLTGNKNDFPHENLERIYSRFIQKLLKDNSNIKIHKSLNGLNYFDVNGFKFLTAHGNNEKTLKDSIKEYEDTYDIKINYMLVGHLHSKNEIEVSNGKEVIQVRSLMGINEYSTSIKRTSTAGALMFTVHKNYGKKYVNEVKF